MKISYSITVCNEELEVKRLINFLIKYKQPQDEICVLLDKPKTPHTLLDSLYWFSSNNYIKLKESIFNGDFSDWKNELNQMTSGDFIFNIDADEIPNISLMSTIHDIIESNPLDILWIPRINTLTADSRLNVLEYVKLQGWSISKEGWINWPYDYQGRIYKNSPEIKWEGKVHEKIVGFKTFGKLPPIEQYSLYHPKTLEKQIKQNNFYGKL